MVRDMRALWIVEKYSEILLAIDACRGWYLGERGAAVPVCFLSTLIRPAADCDEHLAHRWKALSRAAQPESRTDTIAFVFFREMSYRALTELAALCETPAIEEARRQLDELFAYFEKARRRRCEPEAFARTLDAKADRYICTFETIAADFARYERELCGCAPSDPHARRVEAALESIEDGVEALCRREKKAPATYRVRKWVLTKWRYYLVHPEACLTDKAGSRVYVKDVWETLCEEAREKYGIADLKQFTRILRTAERAEARAQEKSRTRSA